jgi:hypothetical protein
MAEISQFTLYSNFTGFSPKLLQIIEIKIEDIAVYSIAAMATVKLQP